VDTLASVPWIKSDGGHCGWEGERTCSGFAGRALTVAATSAANCHPLVLYNLCSPRNRRHRVRWQRVYASTSVISISSSSSLWYCTADSGFVAVTLASRSRKRYACRKQLRRGRLLLHRRRAVFYSTRPRDTLLTPRAVDPPRKRVRTRRRAKRPTAQEEHVTTSESELALTAPGLTQRSMSTALTSSSPLTLTPVYLKKRKKRNREKIKENIVE